MYLEENGIFPFLVISRKSPANYILSTHLEFLTCPAEDWQYNKDIEFFVSALLTTKLS